ncbi:unnamed protein product [Cunninghamella echinulata]
MNGEINQRIKNYVHGGGSYLGLCAGAYYASANIAFEFDTPLEVKGPRELAFYPGLSRGTMYPGFVYNSNKGARSIPITLENKNKQIINVFYNGGGYFVRPTDYDQVTVIATYPDGPRFKDSDNNNNDDENTKAASIVLCKVGKGLALLSGVHPEYDVTTTPGLEEAENSDQLIDSLKKSRHQCLLFFYDQFTSLGLSVNPNINQSITTDTTINTPSLTPIYLCGITRSLTNIVTSNLIQLGSNYIIKDANDEFYLTPWNNNDHDTTLSSLNREWNKLSIKESHEKTIPLMIHYPPTSLSESMVNGPVNPPKSMTPYFDVGSYFSYLKQARDKEWGGGKWFSFGNTMLYSEVITSTQTILDKNYSFSQALPNGLVCLATNQIAGRGRGRNSWVSQSGAVQFSLEIRHSLKLNNAPVVFIQYIIALAVVESIRTRPGYEDVPLRLKWPNDIYADLPDQGLKKVGGLLVNSSFSGDEFLLVIGCGINLSNSQPTVSINDVITKHNRSLPRLSSEDALANILVTFERFYNEFCEKGMGPWFLDTYYKRWLHSDKLVTLTTHENVKAKIVGITSDYGMLEVVDVNNSHQKYTLQPDGNSFDMLKGLIIKKS